MQQEIDSVVAKLIPDKRVEICNITCKTSIDGIMIIYGETTNPLAKNEIIKTLNKHGNKLIDSIIILPDTIKNPKFTGLATISVINLRKEPDHSSELVSQAIMGTPVLVLKDEGSWLLIQTPDKYIAWTEKSSVKLTSTDEMKDWKTAKRVIYIRNSGWIYSGTSENTDVVGDLVAGSLLEESSEVHGFIEIKLPDGRKGFVNKKEVIEFETFRNQDSPGEDRVIKIAASLLGIPYLWGGTSTKGVDCSGFVQTVYFLNGTILMRDASLQALHGDSVNIAKGFSELRKGDLLFFGSRKNSKSHVTHVAIYMGDNEYINSSGRVMVNSLDSADVNFNRNRLYSLLEARRIIGVKNDPGIVPVLKHKWY